MGLSDAEKSNARALNSNIGCFEISVCRVIYKTVYLLNSNIGCFEISFVLLYWTVLQQVKQ